ncbi:hypothetical protein ABIC78_002177 [Novosphingobium sp. 1529]|uniref:DUF4169 family protein n=1 Tax=Novosphingobium TaxID=165696 RepID=UPI0003B5F74A|nr:MULTISPECIES: DUF4169 family protein [Novosphingobium]KPF53818.1 hypothetical protein IP65_12485 [Novosphingobium sp. AAP1]WQD92319.1 DUF4169 family protein [Novosphingobium capsulatum]
MAQVINLRQARKARDRQAAQAQAAANRARFGRTKAEKAADLAREEQARRQLDGHRLDHDGKEQGQD